MRARFEKVVAGEERLFRAQEYWAQAFDSPYHFHPEIELAAILHGNGRRIVGDHIATFGAGDLVLIGENLPHQYAGGNSRSHRRWAGCALIQFSPEALGVPFLNSLEGARLRALLEKARRGLTFPAPVAHQAIAKMRTIVKIDGTARFIALLELLDLLASSKETHYLASRGHTPSLDTRNASRMARACEFIQRRFHEPIHQTDVAASVALSPPAFSRMFRQATRLTFTKFLSGVRLSEASRLLIETDATIAQICHQCGFANLSNFNRRFLAAKKMTPRQFRQASIPAIGSSDFVGYFLP